MNANSIASSWRSPPLPRSRDASLLAQAPAAQAAGHLPELRRRREHPGVGSRQARPAVKGLTTADFEVRDNGLPRPILSMRSDQSSPSQPRHPGRHERQHARRRRRWRWRARRSRPSSSQLREGEDEVALFTFDSALHERQPFTTSLRLAQGALDDLRPFGSDFAVRRHRGDRAAARRPRREPQGDRHPDRRYRHEQRAEPRRKCPGLASSIDVPVYVVATVPAIDQVPRSKRRTFHSPPTAPTCATWRSGPAASSSFAQGPADNIALASNLLEELRQRYLLAIEARGRPNGAGSKSGSAIPSAIVKARSGYFGG